MQSFLHNLCTAGMCLLLVSACAIAALFISSVVGVTLFERM